MLSAAGLLEVLLLIWTNDAETKGGGGTTDSRSAVLLLASALLLLLLGWVVGVRWSLLLAPGAASEADECTSSLRTNLCRCIRTAAFFAAPCHALLS
jgi:hypothetical protein